MIMITEQSSQESYDSRKSQYDEYLESHISNVIKSWYTIGHDVALTNTDLTIEDIQELENEIENHDESKYSPEEYEAYLNWFYPSEGSPQDEDAFNKAWSHHQRNNSHHYQHFILVKDSGNMIFLDMPAKDIIHMLCDWHSFSASDPNSTAYNWYYANKSKMRLSDETTNAIERFIDSFKIPLTEISSENIDGELTEDLELSRAQLSAEGACVSINSTTYVYTSEEFTPEQLVRKFNGIYKYSHGKALQWIKRHSDYISKGKPLAVIDDAV